MDTLDRYLGCLWHNLSDVYKQLCNDTHSVEVRSRLREEHLSLIEDLEDLIDAEDLLCIVVPHYPSYNLS